MTVSNRQTPLRRIGGAMIIGISELYVSLVKNTAFVGRLPSRLN